jgi:nitrous oxide reductase accessory protein NosL
MSAKKMYHIIEKESGKTLGASDSLDFAKETAKRYATQTVRGRKPMPMQVVEKPGDITVIEFSAV